MSFFAYGTLMTAEGFRPALGARAEGLRFRVARLRGWRRVWNGERAEWDGAILNIEPSPGAEVVGVLVEGLTEGDFAGLDAQEASHLPREGVEVELEDGGRVAAQLYRQRRPGRGGTPSARYEQVVLARARQAGPAVLESVRFGSVDPAGRPRTLPTPA